jgi:hypothetical protein
MGCLYLQSNELRFFVYFISLQRIFQLKSLAHKSLHLLFLIILEPFVHCKDIYLQHPWQMNRNHPLKLYCALQIQQNGMPQ